MTLAASTPYLARIAVAAVCRSWFGCQRGTGRLPSSSFFTSSGPFPAFASCSASFSSALAFALSQARTTAWR